MPIPAPGIPYGHVDVEPGLTLLVFVQELQIDSLKNAWVGD